MDDVHLSTDRHFRYELRLWFLNFSGGRDIQQEACVDDVGSGDPTTSFGGGIWSPDMHLTPREPHLVSIEVPYHVRTQSAKLMRFANCLITPNLMGRFTWSFQEIICWPWALKLCKCKTSGKCYSVSSFIPFKVRRLWSNLACTLDPIRSCWQFQARLKREKSLTHGVGVDHHLLRLVLGADILSPSEVGALSMVIHPDDGWFASTRLPASLCSACFFFVSFFFSAALPCLRKVPWKDIPRL